MERTEIDALKARNPIDKIMEEHGHKPVTADGPNLLYFSPFADETVPAFRVDLDRAPGGRFTDGQSGRAGDVIDLVSTLRNCSFMEAVDILNARG
jgi:DNA primase